MHVEVVTTHQQSLTQDSFRFYRLSSICQASSYIDEHLDQILSTGPDTCVFNIAISPSPCSLHQV